MTNSIHRLVRINITLCYFEMITTTKLLANSQHYWTDSGTQKQWLKDISIRTNVTNLIAKDFDEMGTTLLGIHHTKSQTQFTKKKKFMTQRGNTLEIQKDIQQKEEEKKRKSQSTEMGFLFTVERISTTHQITGKRKFHSIKFK